MSLHSAARKLDRRPINPQKRLMAIARILEDADNRCMAVDGPVTPTRHEITDWELREIYLLATGSQEENDH